MTRYYFYSYTKKPLFSKYDVDIHAGDYVEYEGKLYEVERRVFVENAENDNLFKIYLRIIGDVQ